MRGCRTDPICLFRRVVSGAASAVRASVIAAIAAMTLACAHPVRVDPRPDDPPGHRLADIHPQVYVRDGEVVFFLCRWTTRAPIPVEVDPTATPDETAAIAAVLRAYEGAGLGVRFVTARHLSRGIRIEFADGAVATPEGPDAGNTVSDCLLAVDTVSPGATRIDAELVRATVRVGRRSAPDWRGVSRPLGSDALHGLLLHELGHALGFSGHARRGDTVMVKEVEAVRRTGAVLVAGGGFRAPTLEALYRRPSGTILARAPVEAWRSDRVDRMALLARSNALDGPFVRTGETRTRIFWVDTDTGAREYGLVLVNLVATLREPERALVSPEARTRRALSRSRDPALP